MIQNQNKNGKYQNHPEYKIQMIDFQIQLILQFFNFIIIFHISLNLFRGVRTNFYQINDFGSILFIKLAIDLFLHAINE